MSLYKIGNCLIVSDKQISRVHDNGSSLIFFLVDGLSYEYYDNSMGTPIETRLKNLEIK